MDTKNNVSLFYLSQHIFKMGEKTHSVLTMPHFPSMLKNRHALY